jgi:hypothetical protein
MLSVHTEKFTRWNPVAAIGGEVTTAGLQLLKTSEGFRSSEYVDVAGFPSIG